MKTAAKPHGSLIIPSNMSQVRHIIQIMSIIVIDGNPWIFGALPFACLRVDITGIGSIIMPLCRGMGNAL